jgi:hypothetical protein
MLLYGVIGEDYDGFVTDSNLFLLTQNGGKLTGSFEDFPKFSQ